MGFDCLSIFMTVALLLKKLAYQTRYRGMLETELMLQKYIQSKGQQLGIDDLRSLDKLLATIEEPKLLAMLTASSLSEDLDPTDKRLLHDIRSTFFTASNPSN